MWAVINSENKVVATISVEPSQEILATRNEFAVECGDNVMPGMLYENETFKEARLNG